MGFNIASFGKIFNTVTSNLSSLSTNINSLLGRTGTGDEATRTAPFTQPFSNNGSNDSTLRNLALNFNPTRTSGQDKKLQTYKVEIPLAKGSQKASYEELSRRTMRTALEVNGIKPTNRELEEMMATLDKRPIDFDVKSDDPTKFRATMATPKHIGTTASGEKVMGYSFEMDDKFQRTVIKDHKAAQAALAGKPEEKAVIDMNLTERMGEAIKIAYEKGHISKEVREQLGNLTPTELTVAFGMGGAASLAAKTGARAVLAPAGAALLGMEMIKNGAELEVFGKACAKATTRAELEKPAAEFGKWMGGLAKDGVLATAAGAGAKIAPGVMPKATAAAEGFFTTSVKGAKEAMRSSTKGALAPELVTPEGVTIKTPELSNVKGQKAEDLNVYNKSVASKTNNAIGGAYKDIATVKNGVAGEVHHMPSNVSSSLSTDNGPAIWMEKADHLRTASWGRGGASYQAQQKALIDQGRIREAIEMDINDIRSKFGNKYDQGIEQMLKYVDELDAAGKLP